MYSTQGRKLNVDTHARLAHKRNLICMKLKWHSRITLHAGVKQYAIHLRTRRVAVLRLHCVKITMELGLETNNALDEQKFILYHLSIKDIFNQHRRFGTRRRGHKSAS